MLTAEAPAIDEFDRIVADEMWPDLVIDVAERAEDESIRQQAAHFIGSVAVDSTVETESVAPAGRSLAEAICGAAEGNVEDRQMVEANVRTDVVERTIKSGHIMKVQLAINADGEILQHGQTAAEIQANSLRFAADSPEMRARTEVETRNMLRIGEHYRRGELDDYAFVVLSRAADDMSLEEMEGAGFFTDTMSAALQITTVEDGRLTVESAFVAGRSRRTDQRHDAVTIARLGEMLGVDLGSKSATELLDAPLLIHKSLLPAGAIDLVKMYDEAAGGTFFGEAKPQQDYRTYRQQCHAREAAFEPRVQAITNRLIGEADRLINPRAASQRLSELSQQEMLEHSIIDTSIDPLVFGAEAAWRIEQARYFHNIGDFERANAATNRAQSVARSSSCPGGAGGGAKRGKAATEGAGGESGEDETGDCEFTSKKCPICGEKNAKTKVVNGKYFHVGKGCKA